MKYLLLATALCFVGAMGGQAQTGNDVDPYAPRINSFIQGTRDTYEYVRNWQALTEREHEAATRGVMNAIASVPDPVGDIHSENIVPCSAEPSERLRAVCSYYERDTLLTAHRKATDPEYVRGQVAMLRMINDCQAPGIQCFGEVIIQPR